MLINNMKVSDPHILVSMLNTKLRNDFKSLSELCKFYNIDLEALLNKVSCAGYRYNDKINQLKIIANL